MTETPFESPVIPAAYTPKGSVRVVKDDTLPGYKMQGYDADGALVCSRTGAVIVGDPAAAVLWRCSPIAFDALEKAANARGAKT